MILKSLLNQRQVNSGLPSKTIKFIRFLALLLFATSIQANAKESTENKSLFFNETSVHLTLNNENDFSESFKTITGTVVDNNEKPLSGVSVTVKGSTKGTSTNSDGRFSIDANSGDVLEISMIGYKTKTVKLGTESNLSITLDQEATLDSEIVIVGFGTQKKVNLTGSVSTVNAKQLESRPVTNVGQALQGLVPGLNFSTAGLGGELNQNLSFNIRGTGTIGATSSAPLVLIDGMEGDMNSLNPQDIASISVLKDAASASIYGSRAAFGVILITTKKGSVGKTKINYNNNFRYTSPLGLPKMLDSYTFAMYWNEAAANDGEGAKFSTDILDKMQKYQNGEIDYGTEPNNNNRYNFYTGSFGNTDWFKSQYKDNAFSQDHNLSLSGGTKDIQYYVSSNILDQDGLSRYGGDHLNRYTFTGKINATLNKYIKLNYNTKFIREDYRKASHMDALFYHNIARRWPTVPEKDPNGHWTDPSEVAPLIEGGKTKDQTDWLYQQAQLVISPAKGWNIYAEGNVKIINNNYHNDILPSYAYDALDNPFLISVAGNSTGYTSVYEYNRKSDFFNTNIYSDYRFVLADVHQFKIMGGFNSELNKYRTIGASRTGLITPSLPTINTATDNSKANEGQYQNWATAGFFGRLNYNYKEKYLFEANARYDGTSRYIEEKRWNLFTSFSAGWNIAKEDFWGNLKDHVQLLKFRVSYGELGNQNTGNWYPFYLTLPVNVNNGGWLLNGQKPTTANAPGLISTMLTWERVKDLDFGVDLGVFSNRLNLSFNYFDRKTVDMVGPAPELPRVLGVKEPDINNTDMVSKGFDIEATWSDRIGKVNYSIRGVLSDDRQTITNYPNTTYNLNNWYNGRVMGQIWGYTTIGIAKSQKEMDAHLATVNQNAIGGKWGAGDIMYADLNGDGKIDGGSGLLGNSGDRTVIGNSSPRYRYSADLTADYAGFDVRIFLQGIGKRDWMPNGPYFWGASGGMWQSAGFTEHMDFYRDETSPMVIAGAASVNTDSYFGKPYFNTGKNQQTQTRFVQNAAYLRVKNLQLGYTIPYNVLSKVGVNSLRIYTSAENMFTFTKMSKIFDPETVGLSGWNDGKTYPLAKVISFGLNVTF